MSTSDSTKMQQTVAALAGSLNMPATALLSQLREAGVSVVDESSPLTDSDKKKLLLYIKNNKPTKTASATTTSTRKKPLGLGSKKRSTDAPAQTTTIKKRRVISKPSAEKVDKPTTIEKTENTAPPEVIKPAAAPAEEEISKVKVDTVRGVVKGGVNLKIRAVKEQPAASSPSAVKPTAPGGPLKATGVKTQGRDSATHRSSRLDKRFDDAGMNKSGGKRKGRRKAEADAATTTLTQEFEKPTERVTMDVSIPESITIAELAQKMAVKSAELIKEMMKMGAMVTINQRIDQDTATLLVEEMGHKPIPVSDNAIEDNILLSEAAKHQYTPVPRAPVVTIMGHVDHGKTSLLDYIRRTRVTHGEAGGITQHIGAYHVETDRGMITFLDTPGHAAFTAMRARGAQCTDIVVLVVAADDGVMPQTKEAIAHAKAAGVPIVVAVNKMDKPEADAERIKTELSQHGVIHEDWGGDTIFQPISAKTGDGIDNLLDSILLQAEVLELTAIDQGPASGVVIESKLDKGRGVVATVLVRQGTLNKGDVALAGREYGRIRALIGDDGKPQTAIKPSMPVEVLGLSGTPQAGDEVIVLSDEKKAREVALFRQGKYREVRLAKQQSAKLDNLFTQMSEGDHKVLNIVLKADVQGSAEAIAAALKELSHDEVAIRIVSMGVGGINESDVNLAIASKAVMIGFNVRADKNAKTLIDEEGIDLRYYNVIYELIDQIKSAILGMLSPKYEEKIMGLAAVKEVFSVSKTGSIAGCMVNEGLMRRGLPIRVLRDNIVIFEGELDSLRRFKDEVAEVNMGTECGVGVKHFKDLKTGDMIETFEKVLVKRKL